MKANNPRAKAKNALRTIGEVSDELSVPTHVLRFWETKFHVIKPVKYNNRRYYNSEALSILTKIKELLYEQNYSISKAINYFKNKSFPHDVPLFPSTLIQTENNIDIPFNKYSILIETKTKLIIAKNRLHALL